MMISNIRAPRLLFRFFFLVSVFPFGLLGFRLVIRSYGVEISWACACRITSFLIYFGAERIRVKLLSFFFWYPPRRSTNIYYILDIPTGKAAELGSLLRDFYFDGFVFFGHRANFVFCQRLGTRTCGRHSFIIRRPICFPFRPHHMHIVRICFDTQTHCLRTIEESFIAFLFFWDMPFRRTHTHIIVQHSLLLVFVVELALLPVSTLAHLKVTMSLMRFILSCFCLDFISTFHRRATFSIILLLLCFAQSTIQKGAHLGKRQYAQMNLHSTSVLL